MTIAEKIYKLRSDNGLSQQAFADKVGVSQSAINYWENGDRQPRISQIKKIAKAFDIALYILLDENCELPDTTSDAWDKRARFSGDTEMEHPPRFTVPMSNDTIWVDADPDTPLNKALQKERNGEELTEEESKLISDYFGSEQFKNAWDHMKKSTTENFEHLKRLQTAYEQLNETGQDKVAEHAEMLAKIPEYRKEGYQEKTDK